MISSLELAELCGVSQGTVDRALHDRPGISARTRARVLEAAERHGYRPNPAVTTLLTGQSHAVGAVLPVARGAFFVDLLVSLQAALLARGLRVYACPGSSEAELLAALDDFAADRMRAAVVVPPVEGLRVPKTLGLPVASLLSPLRGPRTRWIAPDEQETGRRAVAYLAGAGHRRILHLTFGRPSRAIADRARGYRQGMRALGLVPRVLERPGSGALLEAVRRHRATALFCHNDWLALAAIRELEHGGLRVPADVSVLGVDDTPTFRELFPSLTSLRYPLDAVAEGAVAWILDPGSTPEVPAPELVERTSVAAVPG